MNPPSTRSYLAASADLDCGDEGSAEAHSTLASGCVVSEYVIEGLLAEGGMSTVYSAVHPLIGRRAAVKVMSPWLSHKAAATAQFVLEARAINQIGHPNIVDVFACGRLPDGRSYLVMEWLDGETLGRRLWRERLSFPEGCDILLQICDALEAAHAQQIVHLDVKPDNVFLARMRSGKIHVKLLDFGIAKLLTGEPSPHAPSLGAIVNGTPEYISPEQARALPDLDHRSDIYSLGIVAYQMFAGRLPFEAENPEELLIHHVRTLPPLPDVEWTGVPAELTPLLLQLLEKAPELRPTLAQFRERLTSLRDRSTTVSTEQMSTVVHQKSAAPKLAIVAAACALGILFGARQMKASTAPRPTRAAPLATRAENVLGGAENPAPPAPVVRMEIAAPPPAPQHSRRRRDRVRPPAVARSAAPDAAQPRIAFRKSDYLIDYAGARR